MEEKELRIGILVKDYAGNIFKFALQDFCNIKNSIIDADEYCKPIPLTEEWFFNFGFNEISFTQDRNRDWYKMFEIDNTSELISLNYYTKTNHCIFNFDIGYGNKYVDLYYVHQLQNLYFALTNSELNFNTLEK